MNETKVQLITWGITEDSENNESYILGIQAMSARNNKPLAKADTLEAAKEEGLLYLQTEHPKLFWLILIYYKHVSLSCTKKPLFS